MITIIAGTNRNGSNTKKIAQVYINILQQKNIAAQLLSLDEVNVYEKSAAFTQMENDFLKPIQKFIFVIPEYNGSYSGILKLMLDNSNVKECWANKKALLVGVATGRAGNLRGLEHFTGALMHIKTTVHPNRLPISSVQNILNPSGQIIDEATLKTIQNQIEEFLIF